MEKDVQEALFGGASQHLTAPRWLWKEFFNVLHLRELPAYAMAALADVDEPPSLRVVSHGLALRCVWIDNRNMERCYLLHVPWHLVLGVDSHASHDLERELYEGGRKADEHDLAE